MNNYVILAKEKSIMSVLVIALVEPRSFLVVLDMRKLDDVSGV